MSRFIYLRLTATTAEEMMQPNPVHIFAGATVAEAASTLTNRAFNSMPVLDTTGHVIGTISQADIIGVLAKGGTTPELSKTPVQDLMSTDLLTVDRDATMIDALKKIRETKAHRIFVLDRAGLLVGVISTIDIITALQPLDDLGC